MSEIPSDTMQVGAGDAARDIAISEIAYGVGFKSTAHFSRKFKRVYGINPRDFREACALAGLEDGEASGLGHGDLHTATLQ